MRMFIVLMITVSLCGCLDVDPYCEPVQNNITDDGDYISRYKLDDKVQEAMKGHKKDAVKLAELFIIFSQQLDHDGDQDEPVVVDTLALHNAMRKMGNYAYPRTRLGTNEFRELLAVELDKAIPQPNDQAVELNSRRRRTAVRFFREVGLALRKVK